MGNTAPAELTLFSRITSGGFPWLPNTSCKHSTRRRREFDPRLSRSIVHCTYIYGANLLANHPVEQKPSTIFTLRRCHKGRLGASSQCTSKRPGDATPPWHQRP